MSESSAAVARLIDDVARRQAGDPSAAARAIDELGLESITVSEADGGGGGDFADLVAALQAVGRAGVESSLLDKALACDERLHDRSPVLWAARLCGLMQGALATTRRYVGEREQFGAPLQKLPAVARGLSIMRTRVIETEAGLDAALAATDDPDLGLLAWTIAADAAGEVARLAHQLHGAIGVTQEYPLHRWTVPLWSGRDLPEPQRVLTDRLGARVGELGEAGVWDVTSF